MRRKQVVLSKDPYESARQAGLKYVSLQGRGITRRKAGCGWAYFAPDGSLIKDRLELERFRQLAIPPAWTDVWICPHPKGHIQAVGTDARGRKQYRYHPLYRQIRDATKFAHMRAFGAALPAIREAVQKDLALPGLPRRKVLAALVALLEETSIRVGNQEYAKVNSSFGLTTLQDHHAAVKGHKVCFQFKGKSGVNHEICVENRQLARIVQRCQDLPGQELFQYLDDDGNVVDVSSEDLNEYIRSISGADFTAKDFRTWNGTRHALQAFRTAGAAETVTAAKKKIVEVVKQVAAVLGNRPATCRKYYIHPVLTEAYMESPELLTATVAIQKVSQGLREEELLILQLLAQGYVPKTQNGQQ